MTAEDVDRFLTAADLADRWQVTRRRIYTLRWQGEAPPAVRIGDGTLRWRLADVQAYEADRAEVDR